MVTPNSAPIQRKVSSITICSSMGNKGSVLIKSDKNGTISWGGSIGGE